MLGGLIISAILGVARSFAPNYSWFMFLEFLDPAVGSGAYSSGFILGKKTFIELYQRFPNFAYSPFEIFFLLTKRRKTPRTP